MKLFVFAVLLAGLVAVSLAKEPPLAVLAVLDNNVVSPLTSTEDTDTSTSTVDSKTSTDTVTGSKSSTGSVSGSSITPTTDMSTTTDGAESLASGKIFGILILALATKLLAA